MQETEIQSEVERVVGDWQRFARPSAKEVRLTPGARRLLVLLIANIAEDRSPHWDDFQVTETQRVAISLIPAALLEVTVNQRAVRRTRRGALDVTVVSSWELLHSMSSILDRLCPIPKDL